MKVTKISITHTANGLQIDFGSNDWDHYLVLGILEQTKHLVHKEIDKMRESNKEGAKSTC